MRINQFSMDFANKRSVIGFLGNETDTAGFVAGSAQTPIVITRLEKLDEAEARARHSAADVLERAARALREHQPS